MCSLDKCFPWWGPNLTANHLSPQTDDDLKLPPFLTPLYFGLAPGQRGSAVRTPAHRLLFVVRGGLYQAATESSVLFCLLLMSSQCGRKWVRIPQWCNYKGYFPDTVKNWTKFKDQSEQVTTVISDGVFFKFHSFCQNSGAEDFSFFFLKHWSAGGQSWNLHDLFFFIFIFFSFFGTACIFPIWQQNLTRQHAVGQSVSDIFIWYKKRANVRKLLSARLDSAWAQHQSNI